MQTTTRKRRTRGRTVSRNSSDRAPRTHTLAALRRAVSISWRGRDAVEEIQSQRSAYADRRR